MGILGKALFVWRFLWAKLRHPGLETHGFVFLENDVTFKIEKGGLVVLKNRVYVKKGVVFECASGGKILVGEGCVVGYYASINCRQKIEFGVKTMIGHCATVFDVFHHTPKDGFFSESGYADGETIIGDDVMVGAKATVGGDVKIGHGTLIAANAVVHSDLPEFVVVGGVPARIIKERT